MHEIIDQKRERTILVGAGEEYGAEGNRHDSEPFEELRLLVKTAGGHVVGTLTQHRSHIDKTYYIGKGKAHELSEEVTRLEASSVIFDNDLTPAQVSNLQKLLEIKVIDRSGLILDIFALRAKTREAKTQVELAQLKYLLPRLTRQWTHLSRQVGGIGLRGPGETQLEVDRRRVRDRISHLAATMKKIEKQRHVSRESRKNCFKVSLVGYTNSGKSTLLNAMSGADVPVENKLFKTLDSVTRLIKLKEAPDIILSDTVGFIRNLPHDLIASFRSTLEEVKDTDLLLHVIDIMNPEWEKQVNVVNSILADLGVSETETIEVFNKIDLLEDNNISDGLQARYPTSVIISAEHGTGLDILEDAIRASVMKGQLLRTIKFGTGNGRLLGEIYKHGTILKTEGLDDEIVLTFMIPVKYAKKLGIE